MDEWKEITANWRGGGAFVGINAAGVEVQMGTVDEKPGVGPMDMLLMALAGCTGMDITSIMEKKHQALKDIKVIVRGKKNLCYPRYFTDIEVIYQVWGDDIDPQALEQAIELSEKKYCSVGATLAGKAIIKSSYMINPN